MKDVIIIILCGLVVVLLLAPNDYQRTLETCQRFTRSENAQVLAECQALQEKTNTEYLCGEYGCRLEVK